MSGAERDNASRALRVAADRLNRVCHEALGDLGQDLRRIYPASPILPADFDGLLAHAQHALDQRGKS